MAQISSGSRRRGRAFDMGRPYRCAGNLPRLFERIQWSIDMGGFGSGRRRRLKRDLTSYRHLDIGSFVRADMLRPAGWRPLRWLGEQEPLFTFCAEPDRVRIVPALPVGGRKRGEQQTIMLSRAPCRFGGMRPYFVCSGTAACGRRTTRLYVSGDRLLCRHCLGDNYRSQHMDAEGRARSALEKVRRRLGDDPLRPRIVPARPKGMHSRTYLRLLLRLAAAEERKNGIMLSKINRMIGSLPESPGEASPTECRRRG